MDDKSIYMSHGDSSGNFRPSDKANLQKVDTKPKNIGFSSHCQFCPEQTWIFLTERFKTHDLLEPFL